MPKYTLKVGGRKLTSVDTDTSVSEAVNRRLQSGQPQTKIDSGGTIGQHSFDQQRIDSDRLREVKEIRESGGVVAQLVHDKALMEFGTGIEWQSESDDVAEWLNDNLNDIDNLLIELGEDAIWYPYALAEIVETRGGGFSHIEPIEPWTMEPKTNDYGEILAWEQTIGRDESEVFQPSEVASFVLNKASARDKTGISEVLRAMEEINAFRDNQHAISQAVETAAFRRHWWKIGREGAGVIDDNELRRVRNRLDNLEGDTQLITGRDIEHELMDAMDPSKFKAISEMDLRNLAIALGIPIEMASVISEGLGSGSQSDLRMQAFERGARADQRNLADQFVTQIARKLVEEYSPFDADENIELVFGDPVSDTSEKQTTIQAIGDDMTVNERREHFDFEPLDGPEGEEFDSPGESGGSDDGMGGLFGSEGDTGNRKLAYPSEGAPEWDRQFLQIYEASTDPSRELFEFDPSDVPAFVVDRLRDAIHGGAVFSDIESIPSSKQMELRTFLAEELEDGRWNIDGIANRIQDLDVGLSQDRAELIARSELSSVVNTARADGYEERGQEDDTFYWVGPAPGTDRTTECCSWMMEESNPRHGGTPVTLEGVKELIQEGPTHDPDMDDNLAREWTPHPQCRHTFVRNVE